MPFSRIDITSNSLYPLGRAEEAALIDMEGVKSMELGESSDLKPEQP